MRKIVFLLKRAPGMEVADFQDRVLRLSDSDSEIAGLRSYVQSHTLLKGYAKGELLFDVVEEFSFDEPQAARAFRESPEFRAIWDVRREVSDAAENAVMEVDVYRIKDMPVGAQPAKGIEFVNRRPGMDLDAFRKYWRDVHGPLGSQIPTMQRYEQNHLVPEAYANGADPRFDGLAITWFESTQTMREGAKTDIYQVVRADEAAFLPDGHLPTIITREVRITGDTG